MNKNRILFNIYWRAFFVQALWNYERLQNIGFVYALLPLLRALYPDPQIRKKIIMRHMGFFNTHPYMVNVILGLVASLEEDLATGKKVSVEQIVSIKNNMAGPLAAIGDTFFWGTWRPFIALLSVSLILFFFRFSNFYGTWLPPVFFLFVYNLIHLPLRYWSQKIGYRLRGKIVGIIADLEFHHVVDIVRFAGVVVLSIVIVYYFWAFAGSFEDRVIYLILFLLTVWSGYLKLSGGIVFYGVLFFSIGLFWIKG